MCMMSPTYLKKSKKKKKKFGKCAGGKPPGKVPATELLTRHRKARNEKDLEQEIEDAKTSSLKDMGKAKRQRKGSYALPRVNLTRW